MNGWGDFDYDYAEEPAYVPRTREEQAEAIVALICLAPFLLALWWLLGGGR